MLLRTVLFLAAISMSGATLAAPFCAVFSFGKNCYYYTIQDCERAAGSSGACVANTGGNRSGSAPFCVMQSFGAQCFYYDATACRQAAAAANSVCVVNE